MKKTALNFLLGFCLFLTQSCKEKPPLRIGENYFLAYDGKGYACILDSVNRAIISPQIVAWNFDSIFIIVKQKPFYSIYDSIKKKYPNAKYYKKKKLYDECQIFNYWIIDKREEIDSYYDEKIRRRIYRGAVGGPFNYDEYWTKRRELNVPDSLKLKEAERVSFQDPVDYWLHKWFYKPPARERDVE